jgi:hypothetical protein
LASSSVADVWTTIAADAALESPLWGQTLRPEHERELEPVFSPLAEARFGLAVETIYEGYLAHYGRPRLFAAPDSDVALLLGDYLYAHGLVRISALGDVRAVGRLAGLISLCAQLRADGRDGDGEAWAATTALLADGGELDDALASLRDGADPAALAALARSAAGPATVATALAAHSRRVR